VESLLDVDGDVINAVLQGVLLEVGLLLFHLLTVGGGNLGWVELESITGLEVYEAVGACVVEELEFVGTMEGVEEYDFVFVVAQVAQGVEKWLLCFEGIGEDDD